MKKLIAVDMITGKEHKIELDLQADIMLVDGVNVERKQELEEENQFVYRIKGGNQFDPLFQFSRQTIEDLKAQAK